MGIFSKKSILFLMDLLLILTLIIALITSALCLLNDSNYNYIFLWPISFFLFLILNYSRFSKNNTNHFLVLTLIVLTSLIPRYLIYPICLQFTTSGYVGILHISLSNEELLYGTILGAVELLTFSIFLFFYEKRGLNVSAETELKNRSLSLSGNKWIYLIYIIVAIFVYFAIGRELNVIQFLLIEQSYEEINSNIYYVLVKYVLSIALTIIILMIVAYEANKYFKTSNTIHFFIALVSSMLFTCFIIGESRGTQMAIGVLMMLILMSQFPSKRKVIFVGMLASVFLIIISITIFRTGDSTSLLGRSIDGFANQLQVYCGGPASIYQSIKVFNGMSNISLSNLFFDFVRSCFPFNLLLKGDDYTISQLYNLYLYNSQSLSGHIVFSVSYGYIFFDVLGIPLIMCLNYILASKANEIFNNTMSYEIKYVSGYCMLRLMSAFLVNTPTILGSVTQYIGTFGLLILFSNHIVFRKSYK